MTNNSEPGFEDVARDPRAREVARDLHSLFQSPAPALSRPDFAAAKPVPASRAKLLRWPPLAILGTAAALALYLIVGGPLFNEGTPPASAQTLLQRAQTASQATTATTPYHFVATTESGGKDGKMFQAQTETWYGGPGLYRTEERDPATGSLLSAQVVKGEDFWVFDSFEGDARAAHVRSADVSTMGSVAVAGSAASDPLAQFKIGGCQTAALQGTATVAGREASVVAVGSKSACMSDTAAQQVKAGQAGEASVTTDTPATKPARTADGGLTIWIDRETFIPLKTESKNAAGDLVYSYQVTQMTTGQSLPASVFAFQPPAGVHVIEAASMQDLKRALAAGK